MARSIDELKKQYNSAAPGNAPKGMGMGRGRGPGNTGEGKPKEAGKTIARVFSYMKGHRIKFALVLVLMLLNTVFSLVGGYITAPIIDNLTLAVMPEANINMTDIEKAVDGFLKNVLSAIPGDSTTAWIVKYITAAAVVLGVVYLFSILAAYIQHRLMVSISAGVLKVIRDDLFEKLQRLPVRYFDSKPVGEIMSRFTNDIDNLENMINNSLTSLISGMVTLIGTFIFMITTSWILTVITVVFIPIFLFGGVLIGKKSRKYYSGQQAALGAVNGYIEETVSGQKVVKIFNHEDTCCEEFGLLNEDMRDKQFKAQFWGGVMGPIMGNTSQISYAVTVGVGGVLMLSGFLTPGGLTIFARYARQFAMPINNLAQQMTSVFAALAGAERVFEVMDTDPELPDSETADPMENMQGYVVMKDVTFGYRPNHTILKKINLYAKPGQKIAFVGSTGAGKTTVTNLLSRFYDVDEGTITIDGVDVRDIERDRLRSQIAMVLQDTHLFTGTVMENIRYGRLDATDEEVIEAAKTASAHSFIMRLQNGYDTMIEGDGANLSQGQRQLLNIARAALSKAPILVLDEATSSVDTRTERHIEHGMDRLMKNRTTFVIAHRLSTVRNANAIMVMEHGEIIERGSHDELLEMKGRYYELYTGKTELS
ncbi:MAG: ABC transporter ATP-binding protein/permease [Clostridia bacterium]|nr:ABC transporter ATP-binding protein/permease [Clostridia bacterium]